MAQKVLPKNNVVEHSKPHEALHWRRRRRRRMKLLAIPRRMKLHTGSEGAAEEYAVGHPKSHEALHWRRDGAQK